MDLGIIGHFRPILRESSTYPHVGVGEAARPVQTGPRPVPHIGKDAHREAWTKRRAVFFGDSGTRAFGHQQGYRSGSRTHGCDIIIFPMCSTYLWKRRPWWATAGLRTWRRW